jgi:hypothetical protein
MGKLEWEAKDETVGIIGRRWWRFDRQTEKMLGC